MSHHKKARISRAVIMESLERRLQFSAVGFDSVAAFVKVQPDHVVAVPAVNSAPNINSDSEAQFTTGVTGTFLVTCTAGPTASITEFGTLPAGVTFHDNGNNTATLSGTPAAGTGNEYTLRFTAHNTFSPDSVQFFALDVFQPPVVTSANTTTLNAGTGGSFTFTASGFPAVDLAETGALPAGVTFTNNDNSTATLSGTPAVGTGGRYPLTVTTSNGVTPAGTQSFVLTVDQAPMITSANTGTFVVGQAGSFNITPAAGTFPIPVISENGSLPGGVSLLLNADGSATLSGTPNAGAGGEYNFTVTAHNGVSPDATQAFTLAVQQAPAVISLSSTTFTASMPATFTFLASGFPAADLSETGALPLGVTFVNNNDSSATLSGQPTPSSSGVYTLHITANNGISPPASQTFTLTVDGAPLFQTPNTATATVGQVLAFGVDTAEDFPTPTLSETGTLPAGVTFTPDHAGGGLITGTPTSGAGGVYDLTLTAHNGVTPDVTQAFTLTVDQAPTITSASSTTFTPGTPGTFMFTTSAFPPADLSESGALPPGVSFVNNNDSTATLSGTPAAGSSGVFDLTISANNGTTPSATQSFALTVGQSLAFTSPDSVAFTPGSAGLFVITTTGSPTPALTESGSLPPGLSLKVRGNGKASLSGTATVPGVYDIKLVAQNGVQTKVRQTLEIDVTQAPQFTSADTDVLKVGQAGMFTITTAGFPAPAISTSSTLPAGLTLVDNGDGAATLSGTPMATGTFDLALLARNGNKPNARQTLTLKIKGPPTFTNGSTFSVTVLNATQHSIEIGTTGTPVATISTNGVLPTGLTLQDNGDGTAQLNVSSVAVGVYQFHIIAANAFGKAKQTVTLTVDSVPAITSRKKDSALFGDFFSFPIAATGFPVPAITESGSLPSGVTFKDNGNGTAVLSGTPADLTDGVYPLTITAANGAISSAIQNFTLTILAPPTIALGDVTGLVGTIYPDGTPVLQFNAFPGQPPATANVASADFNGDGVPDLVVGSPVGVPAEVKVFDGKTGNLITSFAPLPATFTGGIFVATGDVNDDGTPDIIVGTGAGIASGVLVYSGKTFNLMTGIVNPYPASYTGGIAVAAADFDHDGHADIVTVQNGGGTIPNVKIFSGADAAQGITTVLGAFQPFATSYTGGAFVATGDVNDDGTPDIIVSQAADNGTVVSVFNGKGIFAGDTSDFQSFAPFDADPGSGIAVASEDVNDDGFSDIICTQPNGLSIEIVSGKNGSDLFDNEGD